jgi:hypothetical protein
MISNMNYRPTCLAPSTFFFYCWAMGGDECMMMVAAE